MDPLIPFLLDLLFALEGSDIPIMIGGGYGLFLRRRRLAEIGLRTMFARLPEARATNDLDVFLRVELLADLERMQAFRAALDRLEYAPVEAAKYMQWQRTAVIDGIPREHKIDLLVGPLGEYRTQLKVKPPRVRPRGNVELHAYSVDEAIHVARQPHRVRIFGDRSSGEPYDGVVEIPQAFPYLMMKLHAFADRFGDADKDLGRHHALDAFSIVGMMTEEEYERALQFGREQATHPCVVRAQAIVRDYFAGETSRGVLRLREHPLFREEFELRPFCEVLREIFPTSRPQSVDDTR